MSEAARTLLARFQLFYRTVQPPPRCPLCDGDHIVRAGSGTRTASVLVDGKVEYLREIPIRRVRCRCCKKSWRLRPPGLMPHRHYQLCVVARGAMAALFGGLSLRKVAARCCCSVWTVARWLRWLAGVTTPANLAARLTEASGAPVLPELPPVRVPAGASGPLRTAAAWVLVLLEAIGGALGLEPPGVRAMVEAVLQGRSRHTTYASPEMPDFARIGFGGRLGSIAM